MLRREARVRGPVSRPRGDWRPRLLARAGASPGSDGWKDPADCICLRVSYAVPLAFCAVIGFITGSACRHCYDWLVDGEEEEEGDEAAKKAGYIAIAGGDLEVAAGTGAGASKN